LVFNQAGTLLLNDSIEDEYFKGATKKNSRRNWGAYFIRNDTLFVKLFKYFHKNRVNSHQYLITNYIGLIKEDKITEWRMVKPYPRVNTKFNNTFLINDTASKTIFFKVISKKIKIDSLSVKKDFSQLCKD